MKRIMIVLFVMILGLGLISCAGMQTQQQRGTAAGTGIGAGVGAILGQVIGGDTEATLLGAGIGALLGGIAGNQIGSYMDRQEQELRNVMAASEAASIRRNQDVLTATFKAETFFDFNSSMLKPGAYVEIGRVANVLNSYPQTRIRVEGHTDASGSEGYNLKLSQRRASAVKNALIQRGVASGRVDAMGFGESMPISSSAAANRRVEIVITPVQAQG